MSHDSDEFWGVLFLGSVLIHPMDWEAGLAEEGGCLERQAHSHSRWEENRCQCRGVRGYGIGKKGGLCGRAPSSVAKGRKSSLSPMITVFLSPLVSKALRRMGANSSKASSGTDSSIPF